jgi:predicted DNA-binding transcriptional regulator AlpA
MCRSLQLRTAALDGILKPKERIDMSITNLMDDRQLADFCNVSMRTVASWRANGRGPKALRLGGSRVVRYDPADVSEWLAKQ